MIRITQIVLIFHLLILSGCIGLNNTKAPSSKQVTAWLNSQQYGKALTALNKHYASNPTTEVANQIQQITEQANTFDSQTSTNVNRLINEHKLILASEQLGSALKLFPQGKQLLITQKRLRNTQRTHVSRLQASQLLSKAEWLLKARDIESSLLKIKLKAEDNHDELVVESSDIQETAAELYHLGLKAMQKGDLDLADSTLTMSNKLYKQHFTSSAIERLNRIRYKQKQQRLALIEEENKRKSLQIAKVQKKTKQLKKASNKREFDEIYFKTVAMLKDNQLSAAKINLDKLNRLIPDDDRLPELNSEFQTKLPKHITALINRGRQFYINGKIKKARDIWFKALTLDPKNEQVLININRANKVLGRIDELKGKAAN